MAEDEWLTDYTKLLISEHWKPCGLDEWLLRQLFELMEEEVKQGRRWLGMRAQYAVEWYTKLAIANARKYGKENVERKKCQNFSKALKERLILKYYLSMGGLNVLGGWSSSTLRSPWSSRWSSSQWRSSCFT